MRQMLTKTLFLYLRRTLYYVYPFYKWPHRRLDTSLVLFYFSFSFLFLPIATDALIKFVYMNSHLINLCFCCFSSISLVIFTNLFLFTSLHAAIFSAGDSHVMTVFLLVFCVNKKNSNCFFFYSSQRLGM